ncbi:unnamed protein product [Anisakis simplex]|uniref:Uncharacterized protein n=1 Tax=Anisakis simplex TaxID=6269 RepID=A0A0M3JFT6_ANISI|nr:unnamed protein product [Anisakis simplex]
MPQQPSLCALDVCSQSSHLTCRRFRLQSTMP